MVELKNRCARIVYANEFYILPAYQDHAAGGACVQLPARQVKSWKPGNPWVCELVQMAGRTRPRQKATPAQSSIHDRRAPVVSSHARYNGTGRQTTTSAMANADRPTYPRHETSARIGKFLSWRPSKSASLKPLWLPLKTS